MHRMTQAEWNAEGERRFGPDRFKWRFVCPVCAHVASIADFKQYKDKGATPNSALCECIGRYYPKGKAARSLALDEPPASTVKQPCDYAGYGLIGLSPVEVVFPDGDTQQCFAFAEG